jgi:SAM-dependent methyltransferase
MPYAATDRKEFVKRANLRPEARILDFGGTLPDELPSAVFGLIKPRPLINAIITKPALLPIKNSVFDAAVSYHYFDLVSPEMLTYVIPEIARVLKSGSSFSFMITMWSPQNEQQRSNFFFNEVLRSTGALYSHDIEKICMLLSMSGFEDITVETIMRDIEIPGDFISSHLKMLGSLVKKERKEGVSTIKMLTKQYFKHSKEHGEAMLPALHLTARKE